MSKVAVLGGGISSLAAAYYLSILPKSLVKSIKLIVGPHKGGWIQTKIHHGIAIERGPRSLRHSGEAGKNTLSLIYELGIEHLVRVVPADSPAAKNRYIYLDGKLNHLPSDPLGLMFSKEPITKGLVKSILTEPFQSVSKANDESFVTRRLGSKVAREILSAVVHGIYAGSTAKLSIKSTFKSLWDMEKRSGSLILDAIFRSNRSPPSNTLDKGLDQFIARVSKAAIYSFHNGMQTLSDTLEERVKKNGVEIVADNCVELDFNENNNMIKLSSGEEIFVDHVFSGIPANILSNILNKSCPDLAMELGSISYVDVAVVNLIYDNSKLPIEGFGFLVAKGEALKVLGVVFDSCSFPSETKDQVVLTAMMGGHLFQEQFGDLNLVSKTQLQNIAIETIENVLGIKRKSLSFVEVTLQQKCIPQYEVGHTERLMRIEKEKPSSLSLIGASFKGVSLNDCIFFAREAVRSFSTTLK